MRALSEDSALCCGEVSELTSVTRNDLVEWLTGFRRWPKDEAMRRAREIVATTGGGRYDLVVKHLAVLPEAGTGERVKP